MVQNGVPNASKIAPKMLEKSIEKLARKMEGSRRLEGFGAANNGPSRIAGRAFWDPLITLNLHDPKP